MLPITATLASVALLAVFAARHFDGARAAVIAVLLFATMPVAWMAAGGNAAQIVLVPFLVLSLIAIDAFLHSANTRWLLLAGGSLALMIYAHLAGLVMAPAYLAVVLVVLINRSDRVTAAAALAAGFALAALPWAIGVLRDSAPLAGAINTYGLYDANRFNPLQGMREMTSWTGLTVRSEVYWDSFNPALLFLGDCGVVQTLAGSRVFLLPLVFPLVRGLAAYLTHPRGAMDWVVLGAFVVAPAAAALIAQPDASRLILLAAPAAIIATRGCYPGAFKTTPAASPATPAIALTTS
jgi:4-amino-4-deoxy-L-arabinose transferase-like glycosyltransferase